MNIQTSFDFLLSDRYDNYDIVPRENVYHLEDTSIKVLGVYCRIYKNLNETIHQRRKTNNEFVCIRIEKDTELSNELELVQKAKMLKRLHVYQTHYKIYVEIISSDLWPAKYLHIDDMNKRYLLESTNGIILLPDEFIFFDIKKLLK